MKLRWLIILGFMMSQLLMNWAKASVELEIDPATFAFEGDSLHLRWRSDASHWRWGLGTYSLEIPDALVDMNEHNKKQGWGVTIDRALGLFTEYYMDSSGKGFFVGAQLSQQEFSIEKSGNVSAEFTNNLLMLNIGYRWQFQNSQFYLLPWAGIGYTKTVENKAAQKTVDFDQDPVSAFMTLHLGYSF